MNTWRNSIVYFLKKADCGLSPLLALRNIYPFSPNKSISEGRRKGKGAEVINDRVINAALLNHHADILFTLQVTTLEKSNVIIKLMIPAHIFQGTDRGVTHPSRESVGKISLIPSRSFFQECNLIPPPRESIPSCPEHCCFGKSPGIFELDGEFR